MAKQNKVVNVLSKASLAGMVASAMLTSQAFAAVDAYTVKVGDDVFKYDKAELVASFLDNSEGLDAPLYEDFTAKVSEGKGVYAFHDDKNGYVDFASVSNAFLNAEEGTFNLNAFTESEEAEVVTVPTVKKVTVVDGAIKEETEGEVVTGDLKVESVSAINNTRLEITFNKAVEDADDIEKDGNRVVVYDSATDAQTPLFTSTVTTFNDDKKGATVILDGSLVTGKKYIVALVDDNTNPQFANIVAEAASKVLIEGLEVPETEVNDDQDKIIIKFNEKMAEAADDARTAANYILYDTADLSTPITDAITDGDWVDSTTRTAVEFPVVPGKLLAGKKYKVVVDDLDNVKTNDGTALSSSQKIFSITAPTIASAKPQVKLVQVTDVNEIQVTFDRDVEDATVANTLISVKNGSKTVALSGANSTLSSNVLTINTTTDLETGESYTVELPASFAINSVYQNAANDAVTKTVTTAEDKAVTLMAAKFVRQTDDKTKYDLILTFDQPVKGASAQGAGDIVINASGNSYSVNASAVSTYADDVTGKSLVIEDVAANTTSSFVAEAGKSYEIVAASGTIQTNTPGSAKTNTKDLKTTIAGIDVKAPELDEVTLVSADKITVKFDETINTSALTAGDIEVKGFVKNLNGANPLLATLTGSTQIKFSVSGDTISITPANSSVKFATGDVNGAVADIVKIAADKIKDSNGIVDEVNGYAVDSNSDEVLDLAAPAIISAEAEDNDTLAVVYSEDAAFKATDANKEAAQFSVSGVKVNQYAEAATFTNNVLTLTFTGSFEDGKDYSAAKLSYTKNTNYRVQDASVDNNQASSVTFTGLKSN